MYRLVSPFPHFSRAHEPWIIDSREQKHISSTEKLLCKISFACSYIILSALHVFLSWLLQIISRLLVCPNKFWTRNSVIRVPSFRSELLAHAKSDTSPLPSLTLICIMLLSLVLTVVLNLNLIPLSQASVTCLAVGSTATATWTDSAGLSCSWTGVVGSNFGSNEVEGSDYSCNGRCGAGCSGVGVGDA